jgi:pSer/pThr/pTyr-binding forkhead associated (FHA) protein
MLKLIHSRDGTDLNEFPIEEGVYVIGRRPDCQIRIDDTTVSGVHAEVRVKASEFVDGAFEVAIEDKGSTNGTLINGRPVRKYLMKHDDVMRIGLHDFTLVDGFTRGFETTRIVLPEAKE